MRRIAPYIISLLACCLPSCEEPHPAFEEPAPSTITIAHLKSLCHSTSDIITNDISIEGYVVANDLHGEYNKAIIIGDESGCIEILVDYTPAYVHFPVWAQIRVHCTGLALGTSGGRVVMGAPPSAEYNIDRLTPEQCAQHIRIDKKAPRKIEPQTLLIAELEPHHIGCYVRLENVTFGAGAGEKWCSTDPTSGKRVTTTHTIYDTYGNSLMVRTIAQCAYGDEAIPDGYGSLCGIVEYFGEEYSLRIVNHRIEF